MSDSLRPHGLQPTRFLHPCNFPGKNTGVGCQEGSPGDLPEPEIKPRSLTLQAEPPGKPKVKVTQSYPTLCDACIVHGILQARILEWVAFPFPRGSSQPRDRTRSPVLQTDSLPAEPPGKPNTIYISFAELYVCVYIYIYICIIFAELLC